MDADPEQEQAYAYLPPQATRGATRMIPTAGRTWQQRRLIRGAGAQTRAVGTAWSRLSSQQREAFGSHRGFRAHLEATAMNRAVQSAEAKEEAARQAGRAAANAGAGTGPGTTPTAAAASTTPTPKPTDAAVIRPGDPQPPTDMDAVRKSLENQKIPRTPGTIDPSSYQRPAPGAPSRPSGLKYDSQGQVIRDWIGSATTRPAQSAPTASPPAAAAAATNTQEQAWAEARRKRQQSRSGTPTSYLGTLRRRIG